MKLNVVVRKDHEADITAILNDSKNGVFYCSNRGAGKDTILVNKTKNAVILVGYVTEGAKKIGKSDIECIESNHRDIDEIYGQNLYSGNFFKYKVNNIGKLITEEAWNELMEGRKAVKKKGGFIIDEYEVENDFILKAMKVAL